MNAQLICTRQFFILLVIVIASSTLRVEAAQNASPGYSPVVLPRGDYRDQIQSMPVHKRPYRPLHFYGNTVRRMHYRGTDHTYLDAWRRYRQNQR
ncbi:MAG: hypothetical protein AAF664_04805 [Planctomycetota bacterium]